MWGSFIYYLLCLWIKTFNCLNKGEVLTKWKPCGRWIFPPLVWWCSGEQALLYHTEPSVHTVYERHQQVSSLHFLFLSFILYTIYPTLCLWTMSYQRNMRRFGHVLWSRHGTSGAWWQSQILNLPSPCLPRILPPSALRGLRIVLLPWVGSGCESKLFWDSFRIGADTKAARAGMLIGRWRSSFYARCIRPKLPNWIIVYVSDSVVPYV